MSQTPVKVSPLIKFARWSMLLTGILYGAFHQNRLAAEEAKIREHEGVLKITRDAQLAEEKKRTREMEEYALSILSKPTGSKH